MKRGDDDLLHVPTDHAYYSQVQGEIAVFDKSGAFLFCLVMTQ